MVKSYAQALRIQQRRYNSRKIGVAAAVRRWAVRAEGDRGRPLPYVARSPVYKTETNERGEVAKTLLRYAYSNRTFTV